MLGLSAAPSYGQNAFLQHNLVSDIAGLADHTDTNLVNPWGISFSSSSPFWIADNGSGLSTLYNGAGVPNALVVTIPPPAGGTPPSAPTGAVFNSTTNFKVGATVSKFLFDTEDGAISAWASGSAAALEVDYSTSNSVFKGLAIGSVSGSNYLYAADFHNNQIVVVDQNWNPTTLSGSFSDPSLPAGFAPFGIQAIGTNIYVSYALQDAEKHDDVSGPGNGFVDVYDMSGNLVQRLISHSALNSPWGMVIAPEGFGTFGGDLLVGNFGDGTINVFDRVTGNWIDVLNDTTGHPIAEPGLWGIVFGNGGSGGSPGTLYFAAGIAGDGQVEDHGLFASVTPAFSSPIGSASYHQHNLVSDLPGVADNLDTNLVNPWGISFSSGSPFWIADNGSGLSTLYNGAGVPNALVVTIPPPNGGTPPSAPTGTTFNSTADFKVSGNASHFIFDTEDGTLSGWASGANAVLEFDNSGSNSVYKGLANGSSGGSNYLYLSDFHNAQVTVINGQWAPVSLAGSFTDPSIPSGFAPFGIQAIGTNIYVSYALQDSEKHDDVAGLGNGYVDVFDMSGNLSQRLISQGELNSPWGMALAPAGFGAFGGALLVGNFGDGYINAYNPANGTWLGAVFTDTGDAFAEPGLWGLAFGTGASGFKTNVLYFTAGIAGPGNVEDHGLMGSLSVALVAFGMPTVSGGNIILNWSGGAGPYTVQQTLDLSNPAAWSNITTTTNSTLAVTNNSPQDFFRIIDTGIMPP
ncbi:MAG TPA: TIGR03118 family protein [Verrucomicrobiae bacterium]